LHNTRKGYFMTNRYAVHFHHPLINFHERDGDAYESLDDAIMHANKKAESMINTSVGKIKALKPISNKEQETYKILFSYTENNKPTGAYIEVRSVKKFSQGKATGLKETYAGMELME